MKTGETDETLAAGSGGDGAGDAAGEASAATKELGRYRLDGVLGQGGMGIVYRAHDPDLERPVALKVLRGAGDSAARVRLLREARAMAQLSHSNVITVFEVGSAGGRDFVAMELIDGSSLDTWLCGGRPLDKVLDVFVQAGRGLAAAHAKGLVHRDFKPHNVLIARDGRVIVTDFGLARTADGAESAAGAAAELPAATGLEETVASTPTPATLTPAPRTTSSPGSWSSTLTATGALVGTPAYMAPEQWAGGVVDPRTDQFSYCVALWEAAAGARPYVAKDLEAQRAAVSAGPPAAAKDVPSWLDAILRRGLAAKAADRWPSMDAVIDAIVHARGAPARRKRNALVVAAIAAVAIAGVVTTVAVTRDRPRPAAPATSAKGSLDDRILKHLSALMTIPSAPGNACEDYLAVMNATKKPGTNFGKALKPEERATLEAATADPEVMANVERLRRGAAKHDCHLMGTLVPWADGPDPMALRDIPSGLEILAHAAVLRFTAAEVAKSGNVDEAKRQLEAIVWMGWQFQQEPVLIYNMIGVVLSYEVAEQLAEIETESDRAGRWRVLAGIFRARRTEDYADRRPDLEAVETLDPAAVERLAAVVDDPDILPGTRAESMRMIAISHLVKSADRLPTDQQRKLIARWKKLEREDLRMLAGRLQAVLDLDAMGRFTQHRVYAEVAP